MNALIEAAKAVVAHEPKLHPLGWFARERGVASAMVQVSPAAIAALREALEAELAIREGGLDALVESLPDMPYRSVRDDQ